AYLPQRLVGQHVSALVDVTRSDLIPVRIKVARIEPTSAGPLHNFGGGLPVEARITLNLRRFEPGRDPRGLRGHRTLADPNIDWEEQGLVIKRETPEPLVVSVAAKRYRASSRAIGVVPHQR